MRQFFFARESPWLTQFLDLSASELRKSARSASISKLQSLLDIALKDDSSTGTSSDNIKVTMATSGLYDWLLKVVRVSGDIDSKDVDGAKSGQEDSRKDKDDKKQMLGMFYILCQISFLKPNYIQQSTFSRSTIMSSFHCLSSSPGRQFSAISSYSDFSYT